MSVIDVSSDKDGVNRVDAEDEDTALPCKVVVAGEDRDRGGLVTFTVDVRGTLTVEDVYGKTTIDTFDALRLADAIVYAVDLQYRIRRARNERMVK